MKYLSEYVNDMDNDTQYIGGLFPKGKLSMIVAEGGIGKTELMLHASLGVTAGKSLLPGNHYVTDQGYVMLIETESRKRDWIRRLVNLEANMSRYYIPKTINDTINGNNKEDIKAIYSDIEARPPELIIVDSLLGFNMGVDENTVAVGPGMCVLADIAEQFNIAVVCTHYLNKTLVNKRISVNNIRGHSTYNQLPQLIWALEKEDTLLRKLYQIKNNLNNLDTTVHKFTVKNNQIVFADIAEQQIETGTKGVRNKIYADNITKSDKQIALLIQQKEPNQTIYNLINWVKRKRKK